MLRSILALLRLRPERRSPVAASDDEPVRPTTVRTAVPGPDPVRVLLLGGGHAVGLHARTREEALDGAIAEALHDRLGRGVVVLNRSSPQLPPGGVLDCLLGTDPAALDLVVWCAPAGSTVRRSRAASWHHALTGLVRVLRQDTGCGIVLLTGPAPVGPRPSAGRAHERDVRVDHAIIAVAAAHEGVEAVVPPPVDPAGGRRSAAAQAYREVARAMLPTLLPLLDADPEQPAGGAPVLRVPVVAGGRG